MTDLPTADDGNDSIMVVVDHGLSKGVVLVPTTKLSLMAERTAQLFLEHVYSHFGLPDSALTDRGPQFNSEFWQEIPWNQVETYDRIPSSNEWRNRTSQSRNPTIPLGLLHQ